MAARLRKTHQDDVRAKIQTSQLVKRLEDHVLKGTKMDKSQVSAAMGLIRKTLPDLSNVELSGPNGSPIQTADVSKLTPEERRVLARVRLSTDS